MPMRRAALVVGLGMLAGCASKGDLRRVEDQLVLSRAEAARQDSARARQLSQVIATQNRLLDSLAAAQRSLGAVQGQLRGLQGDFANEMYNVQQQLVQVQALTGQSQQRLTELRTQLEARSEQLNASGAAGAAGGAAAAAAGADTTRPAGTPASPSANQIYETSLTQLQRGSPGTARLGFRELLRLYPDNERIPSAMYFIGESFAVEAPDSAAYYYDQVAQKYPTSSREPTALYKLGLLAERKKDVEGARTYYQRVVKEYPKSDEAALARERLKNVGR